MRLGCCGSIEQATEIKNAGFDFLEVNVQAVLRGDEPSSTWDAAAPDPSRLALPVEAANCLVPGNRPIIGAARDFKGLQDYMQRVAKRAQHLGIKIFVFGSGGARKRPDNVDPETASLQLAEFTRMAGEICAHHGVTLVIEHLNRKETNTLNLLEEARELCDQVAHPNVAMLMDSYHYGLEGETDEAVLDLGNQLRHVHVAEPVGRVEPGAKPPGGGPAFDFVDFFCLLHKIGYNDRVCVEAGWSGPIATAGPACVKFLHAAWKQADRSDQ